MKAWTNKLCTMRSCNCILVRTAEMIFYQYHFALMYLAAKIAKKLGISRSHPDRYNATRAIVERIFN